MVGGSATLRAWEKSVEMPRGQVSKRAGLRVKLRFRVRAPIRRGARR